jgi:hypothetical protein
LEVAAVAASAASQLSPFEPPQQKERTSPADDCGRKNVKTADIAAALYQQLGLRALARREVCRHLRHLLPRRWR